MAFVIEKGKLKKYIPEGEDELIIPEGVKSIGANVFANCDNIRTVHFAETLTEIGQRSFAKCHNLETIELPPSVRRIANYAFYECSKLRSISLPENMEKIGDSAFSNCKELHNLVLPKQIGTIGKYAFFNCDGLATEDGYVIVNNKLYTYCGNKDILAVPDNVVYIEDKAFESKIVNQTCIGEIREVRHVKKIILPETTKHLGEYAFAGCDMESVIALGISLSSIKDPELKKKVFVGFMTNLEHFQNSEIVRANCEYIVSQKKRYLPYFFENDLVDGIRLIAEAGKIDMKEFDEAYLIPAQNANAIQCCAYLMEWRSHCL